MTQTRSLSLLLLLPLLLLGACARHYTAPVADPEGGPTFFETARVHRVNDGETLYVIAWMYGLDVNALARANNLAQPYTIAHNQMLRIDLDRPVTQTVAGGNAQPAVRAGAAPATARVASTSSLSEPASGVTVTPVTIGLPVERSGLPAATVAGGLSRESLPEPASNTSRQTLPEPASGTAVLTPPAPGPAAVPSPVPSTVPPPGAAVAAGPAAPVGAAPLESGGSAAPEPPVQTVAAPPAALPPPPPAAATGPIVWAWPAQGTLLTRFSDSAVDAKGIDIGGSKGDAVLAAADGEVVYAGRGLLRYGDMIILKHDERFLSAYAHNDRLLVSEGQRVRRGEQIAELGSTGIDRNMLHFEIRLEGKPVDPLSYLPSR